jgi:DivIVA domain-containing protein
MIRLSATLRTGRVPIVSMDHILGWLGIFIAAPTYALNSLSKLVAARLRGEGLTAVPASVWTWLLLSPLYVSIGFDLLGHAGPGWLRWPLGLLCIAALTFQVTPVIAGIVSRRKAGLPWWRFWTAAPSAAADSPGLDNPEDTLGPVVVPDAAALIELIRTARFSTTRLRPGYDEQDVDKFLDKLIAGLGEDGRLNATRVRDVKFSTTRLRPGYTEQEVDDFLDEVTAQAAG